MNGALFWGIPNVRIKTWNTGKNHKMKFGTV